MVVGFAAETDDLMANAQGKLRRRTPTGSSPTMSRRKPASWAGRKTRCTSSRLTGIETWPRLAKDEVARRLAAAHRGGADLTPLIRPLALADMPLYRPVRLRALRDHPEAFGASFEDEETADLSRHIGSPPSVTFGAFVGGALAGTAGLMVSSGLKRRHRGTVFGVYRPDSRLGHWPPADRRDRGARAGEPARGPGPVGQGEEGNDACTAGFT